MKTLVQLVADAQSGDRDAFGELYKRYHRKAYTIARRLVGNLPDAQEVCHDAFIHAMQKINQLHDPARFPSWLWMITRRVAIDRMKRRSTEAIDPYVMATTITKGETPFELATTAERRAILRSKMTCLCDMDQKILKASYFKHLSMQEISEQFNVPVGTAKSRLNKAKSRLKEILLTSANCAV